jgi:hypothetical protein
MTTEPTRVNAKGVRSHRSLRKILFLLLAMTLATMWGLLAWQHQKIEKEAQAQSTAICGPTPRRHCVSSY